MPRGLVLALASLLASCALDVGANGGVTCGEDGVCPPDSTCYRGFCIAGGGGDCAEEGMETDCYTGEGGTVGVGACRPGLRTCTGRILSSCRGEIVPGLEICNSEDDDCDGRIDEVAAAETCSTGLPGVCAEGSTECVGLSATCVPLVPSRDETCDGTDDDCDGQVDEIGARPCYPDGTVGCTAVDGTYVCTGLCAAGHVNCSDAALTACTGAILPAATDGCTPSGSSAHDDDCDGSTDEDCACLIGATQPCYDGPAGTAGVGPCAVGAQTCELDGLEARFGACAGMRMPSAEACNNLGVDDDCNGTVDDQPTVGDACVAAAGLGICHDGTRTCIGGALACVTPMPRAERCDGLDDDCDGRTDETFSLFVDPLNCGTCGNACGTGTTCCGGSCVNLQTSATHCGSCTNACGMGVACCDAACVDLDSAETDCGACGHTCGAREACTGGLCCAPGSIACDAACTDPRTDELNCGGCGVECHGNETCTASCCCRADGRCRCG